MSRSIFLSPLFSPFSRVSLPADDERRYREHFLRQDARRLLATYGVALFFSLAYIAQDYLFLHGQHMLLVLFADRLAMAAVSLVAMAVVWRGRDFVRVDRTAIACGVLLAMAYLPIIASRPSTFTHNLLADIVIVMLFHLTMPDNPRWRVLPGLAFTAVSLGTLLFFRVPQPAPVLVAILTNFFVVNLACIVLGNTIARYRRRFWVDQCHLDELARQRLEMLEARNQLIATLSHEFRTPLNAVAGSASLLDGYLDRLDGAQRQGLLARIQVGVARLTEMLDQALFISRTQSDRLVLKWQNLHVDTFFQEVAGEMRLLYPDCRVTVSGNDGARTRRVETALLRLVVCNLVSNASKFSLPGGRQELGLDCDESGLRITVRDSGIGIAPDELARIFSPFVRGGNVGTVKGTGMGLAIVKDIVDRLGGRIALESVVGRGTTARVSIPWSVGEHA